VTIFGGTLGQAIGAQTGIQVVPGELETIAAGNGGQTQGKLQAQTWVPIPNNPNNPITGVVQDIHVAIDPPPGGVAGAYYFTVEDLTTGLSAYVCTITQGAAATATSTACPTGATSCACWNDEESGPGTELAVDPGDSVAIIAEVADNSEPTNNVNVRFSMSYIHDDQN
jgi:hypothetical protein